MPQIVAVVVRHGQNPVSFATRDREPWHLFGSNADILKVDDTKRQLQKEMQFLVME
jgi:hypothetical protein